MGANGQPILTGKDVSIAGCSPTKSTRVSMQKTASAAFIVTRVNMLADQHNLTPRVGLYSPVNIFWAEWCGVGVDGLIGAGIEAFKSS